MDLRSGTRNDRADSRAPPVQFDVRGFQDGAAHWRGIRNEDRFIQAEKDQPRYKPTQIREIAENILQFQRSNGGWPKDYDMLAVLTEGQREKVLQTRSEEDTSFDNHNTAPQTEYLARVYAETGEGRYRKGRNGGWTSS